MWFKPLVLRRSQELGVPCHMALCPWWVFRWEYVLDFPWFQYWYFLICLVCRTCLSSFWISFRGNRSLHGHNSGTPMGEVEFRGLLCAIIVNLPLWFLISQEFKDKREVGSYELRQFWPFLKDPWNVTAWRLSSSCFFFHGHWNWVWWPWSDLPQVCFPWGGSPLPLPFSVSWDSAFLLSASTTSSTYGCWTMYPAMA